MNSEKYLLCDFRSLEMHRLIAEKILLDNSLINVAKNNIERWKVQNEFPQTYLDDWMNYINQGIGPLVLFMVSETEEGQRLRSSSPFAGVLSNTERLEIFKKFKIK